MLNAKLGGVTCDDSLLPTRATILKLVAASARVFKLNLSSEASMSLLERLQYKRTGDFDACIKQGCDYHNMTSKRTLT